MTYIIVLAIFAVCYVYLVIGWVTGLWWGARIMRDGKQPDPEYPRRLVTYVECDPRYTAFWAFWVALLLWPFALPLVLTNAAITRTLDRHDPQLQKQQKCDQEKRIQELEHEIFQDRKHPENF